MTQGVSPRSTLSITTTGEDTHRSFGVLIFREYMEMSFETLSTGDGTTESVEWRGRHRRCTFTVVHVFRRSKMTELILLQREEEIVTRVHIER